MRDRGPHPLVAVEVGNTTIQLGVFERDGFQETLPRPVRTLALSSRTPDWPQLDDWKPPADVPWYVTSVYREADRRLVDWLRAECFAARGVAPVVRRLTPDDFPVEMLFDHQELGVDRAAAVLAANQLRDPQRPAIVIDAGTAITVEGVDTAGRYVGGAIHPGIGMSARALEQATDLLPFVPLADVDVPPNMLGKSTEQAIRGGLYWGAVGAVQQMIERTGEELCRDGGDTLSAGPPQVFLTGGDGKWLHRRLKTSAVFDAQLVLSGIALAAASLQS